MKLLREYIRESLRERLREERRLNEANIIKSTIDIVNNLNQALDRGIEKYIGPYFEQLHQWMEKNADKIPIYTNDAGAQKMKDTVKGVMDKAEEAREQWKKDNPGKKPDWEKTFLGVRASDWLPMFFHDPGRKVWDEHLDPPEEVAEGRITRLYLGRLIREVTEYDDKFERLLNAEHYEQAISLADSLGISPSDIPWGPHLRGWIFTLWQERMLAAGGHFTDGVLPGRLFKAALDEVLTKVGMSFEEYERISEEAITSAEEKVRASIYGPEDQELR